MQLENRGVASRGLTLFVLAGLLSLGSLGDQGCAIRLGAPPPAPPGGQPAPPPIGTPGAPGTTNPPQVAILVNTTQEVAGYAVDTANLTNSAITVELLPATAAVSGTAVTPLMAGQTANVSDGIPNLTYPGHGFRFNLTGLNPAATVGQQVLVRATNAGQIGTSPAVGLLAPTGTTTATR